MTSRSSTLSIPRLTSITKTAVKSRRASTVAPVKARARSGAWVSTMSVLGVSAVVLSLGFYIYTINASVSKGYELKQQQVVMEELKETQKRLMVQQAALGAIVKVNDVASTSGMVPITDEEFLVPNHLSSR